MTKLAYVKDFPYGDKVIFHIDEPCEQDNGWRSYINSTIVKCLNIIDKYCKRGDEE